MAIADLPAPKGFPRTEFLRFGFSPEAVYYFEYLLRLPGVIADLLETQGDVTDLNTRTADLVGGTQYQLLAKATNTNYDYAWSTLTAGTGITVTPAAGTHTIATTITQYTDEMARDALGTALVAGSNVTITVNDGADTITIASTGGGGSGAWEEIAATPSISGGDVTVTGLTLTGYDVIKIFISGGHVTATTQPLLTLYVSAAEVTAGYSYESNSRASSNSSETHSGSTIANVPLLDDTSTNWHIVSDTDLAFSAEITIFSPGSTTFWKNGFFTAISPEGASGQSLRTHGHFTLENAGAIDGFKIDGNFDAMNVKILGLAT